MLGVAEITLVFRRVAAAVCGLHRQQHEEVQPGQAGEVRKDVMNESLRKYSPVLLLRSGDATDLDLASVYLSYAEAGLGGEAGGHGRPRTGRTKSARPKSSKLRTRR